MTDIDSEKIHIEPEITNLYEDLYFKLKIGKDETYVVNNIADLVNDMTDKIKILAMKML